MRWGSKWFDGGRHHTLEIFENGEESLIYLVQLEKIGAPSQEERKAMFEAALSLFDLLRHLNTKGYNLEDLNRMAFSPYLLCFFGGAFGSLTTDADSICAQGTTALFLYAIRSMKYPLLRVWERNAGKNTK